MTSSKLAQHISELQQRSGGAATEGGLIAQIVCHAKGQWTRFRLRDHHSV